MKAGDYLLIQYGHNDEKEKGEGIGAFTTYKADLKSLWLLLSAWCDADPDYSNAATDF